VVEASEAVPYGLASQSKRQLLAGPADPAVNNGEMQALYIVQRLLVIFKEMVQW
jgi:hypothetical protein